MSDGWEVLDEETRDAIRSMGAADIRTTAQHGDAGATDQRAHDHGRKVACSAQPIPKPKKHGPDAGEPSAYAGCGHRKYGKHGHCGAMECKNYSNKCPVHSITAGVYPVGGGGDA